MSDELIIVASLLVAGYILLAMEALVVPGFGVPGIAGLLCLGAGCYLSFGWFGGLNGAILVTLVVISTTGAMVWIPKSRYGRGVVLSSSLAQARSAEVTLEVGQSGVTETDLRPSGIAVFADVRESVVTDGDFVSAGTRVKVVEVEGSRVVVESETETDAQQQIV